MKKNISEKPKKSIPRKPKQLKNLGCQNFWEETPKEVQKCKKLKHKTLNTTTKIRCVTRIECTKCAYFYLVDSSD